jgi:DNA-binding transcriptional ArsR family regulator
MLSYVVRGFADLWGPSATQRDSLAKVVGQGRAALLLALRVPRSTTELADALRLTPGAVSQQLKILHEAGLVSRHRERRLVFYRLSRRGEAMLQLFDDEPDG